MKGMVGMKWMVFVGLVAWAATGPALAQDRHVYVERFINGMAEYSAVLQACDRPLEAGNIRESLKTYLRNVFALNERATQRGVHRYRARARRFRRGLSDCPIDRGGTSLNEAVNAAEAWQSR